MRRRRARVEASFSPEGEVTPQRFEWQGNWVTIEGIGRRWTEGDERCFNVMALGGRLFELRLDLESLRWSVERGPGHVAVV